MRVPDTGSHSQVFMSEHGRSEPAKTVPGEEEPVDGEKNRSIHGIKHTYDRSPTTN